MIESYEEVRKRIRFSIEEKVEEVQNGGISFLKEELANFESLANPKIVTIPEAKDRKKQFDNIKTMAVYDLEHFYISAISMIDRDSSCEYIQDIDYRLDATNGMIHILSTGKILDGVNIITIFDAEECVYKESSGWKNRQKSKDEIRKLQYKTEAVLNYKLEHKIIDIFGWPYFDDVCYFDATQVKKFDKVMSLDFGTYNMRDYPKGAIFQQLNKISYYNLEIDRLELTQKRFNMTRIKREYPLEKTKKILETLRVIEDDHDAVEPLLQTLKDMGIDINKERLSYRKKIDYLVMESRGLPKQPRFNNDILRDRKKNKKKEESVLYNIFKLTKKNKYREAARELLSII